MLDPLHPGLPSRKESAQIFRVHGLLYEEVHLPSHAEHCSLLNTLQLLLKPHQNTLSHFVKTLVITAGRMKKETRALDGDPEQQEQHWQENREASREEGKNLAPGISFAFLWISVECRADVSLILRSLLQVQSLQGVHGPVEERIIEQHLHST